MNFKPIWELLEFFNAQIHFIEIYINKITLINFLMKCKGKIYEFD